MTLEQRLRALGRNPTAVVGAAAGVGLVWIGWRQLRQSPAPIVIAGPATAPDTGATAVAAFQAGAAAASSGFDTGAALGQSALGLAGSAVGDLGGAVGTLAGSQADMGATLSGALSDAIGVHLCREQRGLNHLLHCRTVCPHGQKGHRLVVPS